MRVGRLAGFQGIRAAVGLATVGLGIEVSYDRVNRATLWIGRCLSHLQRITQEQAGEANACWRLQGTVSGRGG